ncbi:MAG: hypothetical protein ABTQ26_14230 [Azonexus sp.]|jgi:hypothetical protein
MNLTKIAAATIGLPSFDPNSTPEDKSFTAEIIPFSIAPVVNNEVAKQSVWRCH